MVTGVVPEQACQVEEAQEDNKRVQNTRRPAALYRTHTIRDERFIRLFLRP